MRNLEYVCLGFPNDWYKVDENLMESKYFKPLLARDADTKEILIDNRGKSDQDSLSTYEFFNPQPKTLSDELIEFISNEEKQLYERKQKWLKEKGDITFFNLQSIQGQLGLLERLKKLLSNSSNING